MNDVRRAEKKPFDKFLTGFDRYANSVGLTYNSKTKYQTFYGGLLTLFTAIILIVFVTEQIIKVTNYQFTKEETSHLSPSALLSNVSEPITFKQDQLLLTHAFSTTNRIHLPKGSIREYFTGIYVQANVQNGKFYQQKTYKSINCQNLTQNSDQLKIQTDGYFCPMMDEEQLHLDGFQGQIYEHDKKRFGLIIGTCADLQHLSNEPFCQKREDSIDAMKYLLVATNTFTQFFSASQYAQTKQLNYQNLYQVGGLDKNKYKINTISIDLKKIKISQSAYFPGSGTSKLTLPAVSDTFATEFEIGSHSEQEFDSQVYMSVWLAPKSVYTETTYQRYCVGYIFGAIGGLMYTLRNICNGAVRKLQNFGLDNSMIRRLYNIDRTKFGEWVYQVNNANQESGKQSLVDQLDSRDFYLYTWHQCCKASCICCCCCFRKRTLSDKLFKSARRKLHAEIDILSIIKQLRVNKFATEMILKPYQRQLVRWFDEYKINVRSDQEDQSLQKQQYQENEQSQNDNQLISHGDNDFEDLFFASLDKSIKNLEADDELAGKLSGQKPGHRSVRRYTVLEDHHLLVNESVKQKAKEGLTEFDCEQNMADRWILAKVKGFEDLKEIENQLGLLQDKDNRELIHQPNSQPVRQTIGFLNPLNVSTVTQSALRISISRTPRSVSQAEPPIGQTKNLSSAEQKRLLASSDRVSFEAFRGLDEIPEED